MSTETQSSSPSSGNGKYRVLAGAIIVQLILGTIYGYSIFWEPLSAKVFPPIVTVEQMEVMKAAGEDVANLKVVADEAEMKTELATEQGYLKYAFSICVLTFAAVMVFAGRVQDLKGPRYPAIIGGMIMGVGFIVAGLLSSPIMFYMAHAAFAGMVALIALMGFHALFGHLDPEERVMVKYAPQAILAAVVVGGVVLGNEYVGKLGELDSLFLLWGTVGFLAGAGVGFAYVCPIAALVKWFPEHKGLVSGLAVAGFGFGAYLFSQQWGALGFINDYGVTKFFIVHGIVCLIGITGGAMLLRNPPGYEPGGTAAATGAGQAWQRTLKEPSFYVLWIMFFCAAVAGLGVIGIVKVFAGEQLVQAAKDAGEALDGAGVKTLMASAAKAVGVLAIFNALGRVIWGLLSDKIGRTPSFVAMFLLQAATMFLLGSMTTEMSLVIAASFVGFNFGGAFALFPSATADLFGAKNLGANYGWVFTSYGIAGVVGIAAGNAAKVATGSYAASFSLAGTLCIVAAGLALVLHWLSKKKAAAEGAA